MPPGFVVPKIQKWSEREQPISRIPQIPQGASSTTRFHHSNFARPLNRQSGQGNDLGTLKPPKPLRSHRGSVTSVYSQASSSDNPPPIPTAPLPRRHPPAPIEVDSAFDLSSVDEEDDSLETPKFYDAQSEAASSMITVTPRQQTPDPEDKPLVSPITRTNSQWSRSAVSPEQSARQTTTLERSNTIAALSAAINANVRSPTTPKNVGSVKRGTPRMPFEDSPDSRESPEEIRRERLREKRDRMAKVPLYESHKAAAFLDASRPSPTETRSPSAMSTNRLLDSPTKTPSATSSDKFPTFPRPAHLEGNAARQAETRGSLTSLPDLIQRATRLASNLDRGRTASRLGLDMMFARDPEKAQAHKRESTYSDVLFSFPQPGFSSRPTSSGKEHRGRQIESRNAARSGSRLMEIRDDEDEHDLVAEKIRRSEEGQQSRRNRRCCGLPRKLFILILTLVILLIAAAVVLPIVLVWLPKQSKMAKAADCARALPCSNGGVSIRDHDICSCICVNGFTGDQCNTSGDPNCGTTSFQEGTSTITNATVGNNVAPILSNAMSDFNVPLNSTVVLSIFSQNNLSCSVQNAFVRFASDPRLSKRLAGLLSSELQQKLTIASPTRSTRTQSLWSRTINFIRAAQDAPAPAETSNGVVFQPSSTAAAVPTSSTPPNAIVTATATSSTTATPSSTAASTVPTNQINFAETVVLYVLQESRIPNLAVNTQQILEQYFRAGGVGSGNLTVDVVPSGTGYTQVTANFGKFSITQNNDTVIGGRTGTST